MHACSCSGKACDQAGSCFVLTVLEVRRLHCIWLFGADDGDAPAANTVVAELSCAPAFWTAS